MVNMLSTSFISSILVSLLTACSQAKDVSSGVWVPARSVRGPCPMMNTLANHGFLPRDGRNLTQTNVIVGLKNGLNFDEALGKVMFQMALVANPEPNATFFTLGHLNRHNVLEHDASLSRLDAYFGDNHAFNQKVFDKTKAYWTSDVLDARMLANSKLFQQIQSRAYNPKYTFTSNTEAFSLGEVCAPIVAFGSFETGTVRRRLVEYFFENERLPVVLGWTKKATPVTLQNILAMTTLMANATSLLTDGVPSVPNHVRDWHGGIYGSYDLK